MTWQCHRVIISWQKIVFRLFLETYTCLVWYILVLIHFDLPEESFLDIDLHKSDYSNLNSWRTIVQVTTLLTKCGAARHLSAAHSTATWKPVLWKALETNPLTTVRNTDITSLSGLNSVVCPAAPKSCTTASSTTARLLAIFSHTVFSSRADKED